MKQTGLVCRKCRYVFNIETNTNERISCPYCKFIGQIYDFKDYGKIAVSNGYARTIEEFKDVLKKGSRKDLTSLFNQKISDYSITFNGENYTIHDIKGKIADIKVIHEYIQKNVIFQRDLYNIWMDTFR